MNFLSIMSTGSIYSREAECFILDLARINRPPTFERIMSSHPENDPESHHHPEPIHGQVRHSNISARISDEVSVGVFSNGVMILAGMYETVLDFAMRMGETQRIVTRVILPNPVARQFGTVLEENMRLYESNFGAMPSMPRLRNTSSTGGPIENGPPPVNISDPDSPLDTHSGIAGANVSPELSQNLNPVPTIDDIYDELKLPDPVAVGRYANAVMVRHSGTEFCFDFIANFYPRSIVTSRVYMASPHVPPVLSSLLRSLQPPPEGPSGPSGHSAGPSQN